MFRDYESGASSAPVMFVGSEVEHTPHYGKKTLFVVDRQPVDEVVAAAVAEGVEHIYLAANHSYDKAKRIEWFAYMIAVSKQPELQHVALSIEVNCLDLDEHIVSECRNLGIHLIVGVPIKDYHEDITVKIDDVDFKASNPGVWCYNPLASTQGFTPWCDYSQDKVIK